MEDVTSGKVAVGEAATSSVKKEQIQENQENYSNYDPLAIVTSNIKVKAVTQATK